MPNNRTAAILLIAAILSACGVCYVGSEILDAASHRLAVGEGPVPTNTAWATLIGSILSTLGFGWAAAWVARIGSLAKIIEPAVSDKFNQMVNVVPQPKSLISGHTQNVVIAAIDFGRLALYLKAFNEATTAAEREGIRQSASSACSDLLNQLFPPEQTQEGKA